MPHKLNLSEMTAEERRAYNYDAMKAALEQALNIANTPGVGVEEKYKGMTDVVWEVLDRCFGSEGL